MIRQNCKKEETRLNAAQRKNKWGKRHQWTRNLIYKFKKHFITSAQTSNLYTYLCIWLVCSLDPRPIYQQTSETDDIFFSFQGSLKGIKNIEKLETIKKRMQIWVMNAPRRVNQCLIDISYKHYCHINK